MNINKTFLVSLNASWKLKVYCQKVFVYDCLVKPHSTSVNIEKENYQSQRCVSEEPSSVISYTSLPAEPDYVTVNENEGLNMPEVTNELNDSQDDKNFPKDYAGMAWLSLLFCCCPVSIMAILQSEKVLLAIRNGNRRAAYVHSIAARKLSVLALIFGLVLIASLIGIYYIICTQIGMKYFY